MAVNRVEELREKNNVKQEQLATMIGTSLGNYSKKEAGIIRFSLVEARKIAQYFKLSIEDIFFDSEVSIFETTEGNQRRNDSSE